LSARIIIAGTRNLGRDVAIKLISMALDGVLPKFAGEPLEIVSGHGGDVDLAGEDWAARHGVPVKLFPADWDKLGRAAGPIRNRQMAEYAALADDCELLLIWDGKSPGSRSMRSEAERAGIGISEIVVKR
jgi:hypothetical protein